MSRFKEFLVRFFKDKRVRFLIVGGLNTVVGIGVTWIVYVCFGVSIFASKESMPLHVIVIGTLTGQVVGTVHSYFWNKYFTFRSKKKSWAEFFRFVLVYAVQYGVNLGLTTLLDRLIAIPWLITVVVTLVCTLLSYFGHNLFSFRKKAEKAAAEDAQGDPSAPSDEEQRAEAEECDGSQEEREEADHDDRAMGQK